MSQNNTWWIVASCVWVSFWYTQIFRLAGTETGFIELNPTFYWIFLILIGGFIGYAWK